jgi:hypothetical protein
MKVVQMVAFENIFGMRIGGIVQGWADKIAEINRRYATPRIKMSPGVRIALLFLRLYLIFLVLLLAYKFWTLL